MADVLRTTPSRVMRWACISALILACACQPSTTRDLQPTPDGVVVRSDIALLAQRIQLPDGVQSARWSVIPLGTTGSAVPGPTDTRLYAFLQPHSAAAASLMPLSADQQHTAPAAPPDIVRSLIPADTLASLQPDAAGDLVLAGPQYDPGSFNRGPYRGVFAVQVGDGLLVCLQTS